VGFLSLISCTAVSREKHGHALLIVFFFFFFVKLKRKNSTHLGLDAATLFKEGQQGRYEVCFLAVAVDPTPWV
jgi:hypothetical protein